MKYAVKSIVPFDVSTVNAHFPTWVIRGRHFMAGYDPQTETMLWSYDLLTMHPYEGHQSYTHSGHLITSYLDVRRKGHAWIFAYRPDTGAVVWHHKVRLGATDNKTGSNYFHQTKRYIMYPGDKEIGVLDAKTGRRVGSMPYILRGVSFQAGGYTYIYNRDNVVRIPWDVSELPDAWEEVSWEGSSDDGLISHFQVKDDAVYASSFVWTGDQPTVLRVQKLDATSLVELARLELEWKHKRDCRIVVSPVEDCVIATHPSAFACLDFQRGEIRWENAWSDSHTVRWSRHGLFAHTWRSENLTVNPDNGSLSSTSLHTKYTAILAGDFLVSKTEFYHHRTWFDSEDDYAVERQALAEAIAGNGVKYVVTGGLSAIYEWRDDGTAPPQAAALIDHPPPLQISPQLEKQPFPEDTQAQRIQAAFQALQEDGNTEGFCASLKEILGLKAIHPDVRAFLEHGLVAEKQTGYRHTLTSFTNSNNLLTYDELWSFGPKDKLFPGLYSIGHTAAGHEFVLMLESGRILALHHDDFFQVAWDLNNNSGDVMSNSPLEFSRLLSSHAGQGPLGKWR